jgi:hypothetical protein
MIFRTLEADQMAGLLEAGLLERRHLEFKPGFKWDSDRDSYLRESVIRTILGMTNTPTGGVLVLGIDGRGEPPTLVGVAEDELSTFSDFESVKATVDGFATMATDFELRVGIWQEKSLLVARVAEFARRPILCRKNGTTNRLREGDLYVRPQKGQPRTDRMGELELEEIIGLSIGKESSIRRAQGWTAPDPDDAAKFYRKFLGDLE